MNDPKYGYPYPPQGVYQGPPAVMAPPQYYAPPPPPLRQVGFLEGCLAAFCCCCLLDECCCDPSVQPLRLDARYTDGRAGIASTSAQARRMNVTSMLLSLFSILFYLFG